MENLPTEDQQKVVEFVEKLARPKGRTLMEKIETRISRLSAETLDRLPIDGAENLDHYLYGHPKKVS
jgi:hypothetical protein